MQVQKTVFISYRRTNIYMARAVYGNLRANGYDAFLDYQSLDSGDFSQSLLSQIAARAHFLIILTPSALERCTSPDDWMRKEIEYAIQQKRNVIPLLFEGFKFEEVRHYLVSDWLKMLPFYNGLRIPEDFFEEAMDRLRSNHYLDRPLEAVLQPDAPTVLDTIQIQENITFSHPNSPLEQVEAEQLYERGFRKSRLMNDYDGAIEDFTRAIALKPNFSEAYFRRGGARFNKDDKIGALNDWNIAIQLAPSDRRVNIIRSAIAWAENHFQLALEEAEIGVQLNIEYDEAYFQRGFARHNVGDFDGSIEDFNEAIRLNPIDAAIYINRGATRFKKGDFKGAIEDFNEAVLLNPSHADAYNNRGVAKAEINDLNGAMADYDKALTLNHNLAMAYCNRGTAWFKKDKLNKAIADFEAALLIEPNHNLARQNLKIVRRANKKDKGWWRLSFQA